MKVIKEIINFIGKVWPEKYHKKKIFVIKHLSFENNNVFCLKKLPLKKRKYIHIAFLESRRKKLREKVCYTPSVYKEYRIKKNGYLPSKIVYLVDYRYYENKVLWTVEDKKRTPNLWEEYQSNIKPFTF
jgi:hypothetical protein